MRSVTFIVPEITVGGSPWQKEITRPPFSVTRAFREPGFLARFLPRYSTVVKLRFHECFARRAIKCIALKIQLPGPASRSLQVCNNNHCAATVTTV